MATMTMTAAAAAKGKLRGLRAGLYGLAELLATWSERIEQRRMLAASGEAMAMDLGVSQAELAAEAAKPFWRS